MRVKEGDQQFQAAAPGAHMMPLIPSLSQPVPHNHSLTHLPHAHSLQPTIHSTVSYPQPQRLPVQPSLPSASPMDDITLARLFAEGNVLRSRNKFADAIAVYDRVLRYRPSTDVYNSKGRRTANSHTCTHKCT